MDNLEAYEITPDTPWDPSLFSDSIIDTVPQESEDAQEFPCLHTSTQDLDTIPEVKEDDVVAQQTSCFDDEGFFHSPDNDNGILGCFTSDPLPVIGDTMQLHVDDEDSEWTHMIDTLLDGISTDDLLHDVPPINERNVHFFGQTLEQYHINQGHLSSIRHDL